MVDMKNELERIRQREADAVKDPRVKALRVIDMLTCNDEFENDKLLRGMYKVAHSASGICDNEHEDWRQETNKLYKELAQQK